MTAAKMKTGQIMNRTVLGVPFSQNHKNEMVNLTEFSNELRIEVDSGNVELITDSTKENIMKLSTSKSPKLGELDFDKKFSNLDKYFKRTSVINLQAVLLNDVESEKDLKLSKRGKYGGTWVHPLIFIDYLMWISPEFHKAGLQLIADNMLLVRDAGGESFKELNEAIKECLSPFPAWFYGFSAKTIGTILKVPSTLDGVKMTFDWNSATKEQLKARDVLHVMMIDDLESGIISNYRRYMDILPRRAARQASKINK